ncbi:MAG TPA: ATP-binding protein [Acidimicrobiales bacterium]|jgi:anti-sigma regulatory factor (Ser/Thr protein kinase)|nr:ATP-binding protein [Acidimicrobiales bacterium]
MRFPADLARIASVRDFAAETADDLGATVDRDDLALIVGELAANAAEHQAGEALLLLRVHADGGVDVEVTDADPTIPRAIDSAPDDPQGHRGLRLVSAISHSWGVSPEGTGKRIWARLSPAR